MADNAPKNEYFSSVALVMLDEPLKGKRYPLKDGRNIVGRSAECDVVLEDDGVSRQHAAITVSDVIEIEDLGSAQGTRHNDRLLVAKDYLFDNDEVRFGSFLLRVEARKRESRKGVTFAISCLIVALAFLALAFSLPSRPVVATAGKTEAQLAEGQTSWENWSNITLPTREELAEANVPVTAESAWEQYRTGTRLHLDRLSDLRNPSRAIRHFKQALAISALLPTAERPAFSHRALMRMRELQEQILTGCDNRIFITQKHYKMEYRSEAMRALQEIQYLTQWPDCRYFHWATEELKRLQTQTRKK